MDFDKVIQYGGPPQSLKEHFYEKYFLPYLTNKPNPSHFMYLLDQAWTAEKLSIAKSDINKMLFVTWICGQLSSESEEKFSEFAIRLLEDWVDIHMRTINAERNLYNSEQTNNIEQIFSDMNRLYKVFFENELRAWGTVPFCYVENMRMTKFKTISVDEAIAIGSGKKYKKIKDFVISIPYGNINELIKGFNNNIRNAGEGHDSWEVTDKGQILFSVVDPNTGKKKGPGEIKLSRKDYHKLLQECRRSLWILKNGLVVYLVNHPDIINENIPARRYKIKEIKEYLNVYAKECNLNIERFSSDEERKKFEICLKHIPELVGSGGQLFIGREAAYDLVNIKIELSFRDQMLRILQIMVRYYCNKDRLPSIKVKVLDENSSIVGEVEYSSKELVKFYLPAKEENLPIPTKGEIPDKKYTCTIEKRVPYGAGADFQKFIDERLNSENLKH